MALVGSALSYVDHHRMNNHGFLWVTVDDCYPLVVATAYEKEHKIGAPVGLLIFEVDCETQTIKALRWVLIILIVKATQLPYKCAN